MTASRTFLVEQTGQQLLAYLFDHLTGFKRGNVKRLLRFGAVHVNGAPVTRHDHPLAPGDRVTIQCGKTAPAGKPLPQALKLVHQDKAVIVVEKPAGMLTVATRREETTTVYHHLCGAFQSARPERGERIYVVHRLDRDTSGLLVFARNAGVKRYFQENWKQVEKRYYAIVEGVPKKREGAIQTHLTEGANLRVWSGPQSAESKYAVTEYRVVQALGGRALVEVTIKTGRKHQIRVHLSELGHPVVGDRTYGAKTDPAGRLALHAHFLAFNHPVTGKFVTFTSELPDSLRRLLE